MDFITKKVDFVNYDTKYHGFKDIEVKWSLELEMRSWGIKDFIILVPNQKIDTSVYDYDKEQFLSFTFEVNECQVMVNSFKSLVPESLSVLNKKWTLNF